MQTCPKCKLVSPDTAERCDCGFDFVSKEVKESYLSKRDDSGVAREVRLFVIALIALNFLRVLMAQALGEPVNILMLAAWSPLVYYLALQYQQRKRWARTALAMLTLPIGFVLFTGRYSRYVAADTPGT